MMSKERLSFSQQICPSASESRPTGAPSAPPVVAAGPATSARFLINLLAFLLDRVLTAALCTARF
jgi:hypothetical protein